MAKRMLVMLAVTCALVAALGFVKFKQIQVAVAQGAAFQPPPDAVTTIVAQLAAVEAQRELARLNFDRMQGLLNERVISRAEFDRATAEHREMEARVGEIRAAIERKTIRAPFSGILGIRQVNLGQYLAGGDPLVSLQSLNPIYVNCGVPQQGAGEFL